MTSLCCRDMIIESNYPTVNDNISSVVERNNTGVAFFESKKYSQALTLFLDALKCISSPAPVATISHKEVRQTIPITNPFIPILKARLPCVEDVTDIQGLLVYTQAIEIVSTPKAYDSNPLINDAFVSAMVIWNMALVYQCTSLGHEHRMEKSYLLYYKGWKLVESYICHGSLGNPMVDFFVLALLNNLGWCCQELGECENAKIWSNHLITYAQSSTSVRPVEMNDQDLSFVLQEQTNNFVLNAIMRLQCRPSFLAAAA